MDFDYEDVNIFDDLQKFAEENASTEITKESTVIATGGNTAAADVICVSSPTATPTPTTTNNTNTLTTATTTSNAAMDMDNTSAIDNICAILPDPPEMKTEILKSAEISNNGELIVINTVDDLTPQELTELLKTYVGSGGHDSGEVETITIVDDPSAVATSSATAAPHNKIEDDDDDDDGDGAILMTESNLAEYFKCAMAQSGKCF